MLRNCLEEDTRLYHPNAWSEGEFEWLKTLQDHSWRISENSWVLESENYPSSSKNKFQHIQLSDTTGTSNGTDFDSQMKQNKKLLAANTEDGFGEQRDTKLKVIKSTPCVQWNIAYCCIFDVVGLYFCCRSWTSCLDTWHYGFYQIPTDKKINKRLTLLEIL